MMSCWAKQPDERPSFSDIVTSISNYTEVIAGYLDINFNPFKSMYNQFGNEATGGVTNAPDSADLKNNILQASTKLLTQQMDADRMGKSKNGCIKSQSPKGSPKVSQTVSPKVSPKSSPKPSPRASPCISPRASPLLKLRKIKDDQLSTASSNNTAIEIHIESPSEDGSMTSGLLSVK